MDFILALTGIFIIATMSFKFPKFMSRVLAVLIVTAAYLIGASLPGLGG